MIQVNHLEENCTYFDSLLSRVPAVFYCADYIADGDILINELEIRKKQEAAEKLSAYDVLMERINLQKNGNEYVYEYDDDDYDDHDDGEGNDDNDKDNDDNDKDNDDNDKDNNDGNDDDDIDDKDDTSNVNESNVVRKTPICSFFINGTCRRGARCKYVHPKKSDKVAGFDELVEKMKNKLKEMEKTNKSKSLKRMKELYQKEGITESEQTSKQDTQNDSLDEDSEVDEDIEVNEKRKKIKSILKSFEEENEQISKQKTKNNKIAKDIVVDHQTSKPEGEEKNQECTSKQKQKTEKKKKDRKRTPKQDKQESEQTSKQDTQNDKIDKDIIVDDHQTSETEDESEQTSLQDLQNDTNDEDSEDDYQSAHLQKKSKKKIEMKKKTEKNDLSFANIITDVRKPIEQASLQDMQNDKNDEGIEDNQSPNLQKKSTKKKKMKKETEKNDLSFANIITDARKPSEQASLQDMQNDKNDEDIEENYQSSRLRKKSSKKSSKKRKIKKITEKIDISFSKIVTDRRKTLIEDRRSWKVTQTGGNLSKRDRLKKLTKEKIALAKLREIDPEKARKRQRASDFDLAMKKLSGVKVLDEPKKMASALRRMKGNKKRSERDWQDRKKTVAMGLKKRANKRRDNLAARSQQKIDKNIKTRMKKRKKKAAKKSAKNADEKK